MLAAINLALLLGVQLGPHKGSNLDVLVNNSVQGGYIPNAEETTSRPTLGNIITPDLKFSYQTPKLRLTLDYQPRLSFQISRPQPYSRPLFLQSFNLANSFNLSKRLRVEGLTSMQVGDVDYTAVSAVFSPTLSTLPDIDLLQWLHIEGVSSLAYSASRTLTLGISGTGDYNAPISEVSAEGLVRSATFGGALFMEKSWNRRASSELRLPITYSWFPEQVLFLMASPAMDHTYALRETTVLELTLGMTGIYIIDSQEFVNLGKGEVTVSPIGSFSIQENFNSGLENIFYLSATFNYAWSVDPILARPLKRAESALVFNWAKEPVLTLGARVAFSTTLPGLDYQSTDGGRPVARADQGALSFSIPFETEINQHLSFSARITSALRGPSLSEGYRPELVSFLGTLGLRYSLERNP